MSATEHVRRAARGLVVGLFGAALLFGWGAGAAHAATIQVNSTIDAPDDNPDDGICLAQKKICTLRAAVQTANHLSGDDMILLPAGRYLLTRAGAGEDAADTGDLDIRDSLSIIGHDVNATIVDGERLDRVFDIFDGVPVVLGRLTVQRGLERDGYGGGGGIRNLGRLILTQARVRANRAAVTGGGILSSGELTVLLSRIDGNHSDTGGGGIALRGSSSARLVRVAVSGNTAASGGGGVSVGGGSVLELDQVGIYQNISSQGGGIGNAGTARVVNTTFSLNQAGQGGGLQNFGIASLLNVTFKDNQADVAGAIHTDRSTITIRNSIVADSTGGSQNCAGPITSGGHNLDSGTSCGFRLLPDYQDVRVLLDDLRDNGGFTLTHRPLPGSPAIDRGPAPRGDCPSQDQRGMGRPADGDGDGGRICDIGAVELEGPGR